jgi:hypothetical protein
MGQACCCQGARSGYVVQHASMDLQLDIRYLDLQLYLHTVLFIPTCCVRSHAGLCCGWQLLLRVASNHVLVG